MNVTRASFSTKARTWVLLAGLTALFIGVGYAIGGAALWFFVLFSVFMNVAAYFWSDKFAIRAARAQEVSEAEAPDLHNLVGELAQLYDVPKPRVYMIPSDQPNAFATGRNPEHAAVAVTQGLLQLMPRDQVRGVLAHEFSHIKNRDILVSSIAAMIAGAISAIGNIFFFMSIFGDDDDNPLGCDRRAAADHHRADRGLAAPARGLAPAGVPRGRHGRADARHGRAARPGARDPRARPAGDADAGQPGDRGALHRQPAHAARASRRCSRRTRRSRSGSRGCASTTETAGSPRCTGETAGFPREPPSPRARTPDRSAPRPRMSGAAATRWTRSRADPLPKPVSWRGRRTPSTPTSTSSSRGPSAICPSASGRSTSTGCIRTWGSSSRSSSRHCWRGTCRRAAASSIRSRARGRRSSSRWRVDARRRAIDVAAFNCLLMRVKTARYNEFVLEREIRDALSRFEDAVGTFPGPTRGPGYVGRWFAPRAAAELLAFRDTRRRLRACGRPAASCSRGRLAPRG